MNGYYYERNIAVCILLSIVTCGLYGIYWLVCLNDEALRTASRQGPSGIVVFLFGLITCNIYLIFWAYKMGELIDFEKRRRGLYTGNYSGILYLFLSLFGLGIITMAILQHELNYLNRGPEQDNGYW